MERTLTELAKEALLVQDACNILGVSKGFARAMDDLRRLLPSEGTDGYNRHPVAVLWASKLASMTGCEAEETFHKAYVWAVRETEG